MIEVPATKENMIIGARVRYITKHNNTINFFQAIGVIESIYPFGEKQVDCYKIKWDDENLNYLSYNNNYSIAGWVGCKHFTIVCTEDNIKTNQIAINDYVCPSCGNEKCSLVGNVRISYETKLAGLSSRVL
jgi:hypothetical protein